MAAGCVPLPQLTATQTQTPPHAMGLSTAPAMEGPRLTAQPTAVALAVDGEIDSVWNTASTLELPLTWGIRGQEPAFPAQLRAIYDDVMIYFLAQWPEADAPKVGAPGAAAPEAGAASFIANKLTVYWTLPPPVSGLAAPACDVACHIAYADQTGRIVDLQAETIPPGADEALPVAGAWRDGVWTVEWSRPLQSDNAYDLQFTDLDASYPFFVKVFEGDAERADPVSPLRMMVFGGA